tara:strand:- start:429 stop:809 length:381 start_codon:yes stop_codon:yes gene_type:complete
MVEVKGFIAIKTTQPKMKEEKAKIKNILKFEYPNTFKFNKSVLFLKYKRNHRLEIKMIKGNILIIKLGINIAVSDIGIKRVTFKFLKNSISSNRFKIKPKQYAIKMTLKILLKNPDNRYLNKTLFI